MSKKTKTYHEELNIKNEKKLKAQITKLPEFCSDFFRSLTDNTSSATRCGYAYDLDIFFSYLCEYEADFEGVEPKLFTLEDLAKVWFSHLERYMAHLTYYERNGEGEVLLVHSNKERGKSRKLSAIRTMFSYLYKKGKLKANPTELINLPKIQDKVITKLEVDEVAKLLDEVESGESLAGRSAVFHKHTKDRDLAIATLLLGTGIRVSECVGIDISDLNFDINGVRIVRKGGDEAIVYFGGEVREALLGYLAEREKALPAAGHENALFLSLRNRRITVRSVQNLVKKYSKTVTPLKNISPHKLRSTYGTNLYTETGDIYLVADVLGHKDVNTTRKHYADMADSRRRQAAKYVVLRKE
ncbi:MAG: tyrosine-type recombinase/integrase [Defluviitaleaceae bacterium]|nr:tyrosine-type recombinase/integrase [Defluviitaleaceae bacterium]